MSEQSYDIQVSLSDTNFNEEDRQEAETLFAQLGRVQMMWYLRESVGDLVPVVIIVVGTAFASGFFGKMGGDTYDALKSRLADWLSRKRHPSEATDVTIELPYDSTTIKAYSKASSFERNTLNQETIRQSKVDREIAFSSYIH